MSVMIKLPQQEMSVEQHPSGPYDTLGGMGLSTDTYDILDSYTLQGTR